MCPREVTSGLQFVNLSSVRFLSLPVDTAPRSFAVIEYELCEWRVCELAFFSFHRSLTSACAHLPLASFPPSPLSLSNIPFTPDSLGTVLPPGEGIMLL